jgi:ubiquinone/menaquinone biosynthesis C-methylase UbiE
LSRQIQNYYRANPLMISSPFGGVTDFNEELLAEVFGKLRIELSGRRVLDVGCGRGLMAPVVTAAGGRYTGADFVPSGKGFPLAQADAQFLPFLDEQFDAVFCFDAMEHFPDLHAAAREFRRVLRPGGFWFLSIPNYANVAGLVKKAYEGLGWYERDTWAPFRRWQAQELEQFITPGLVRRVARDAGFSKIAMCGHGGEVGLGLFPWIDHPKTPDAIRFRAQRFFRLTGPAVAAVWPGASLHTFWKFAQ